MTEIKIQIPEGYEGIDKEKSNLEKGVIIFKKKELTPWRECTNILTGYLVAPNSSIVQIDKSDRCSNNDANRNIFATKKQAESMLAMAQLSQIIQNDPRFGGPITDEEWPDFEIRKYVISRFNDDIYVDDWATCYFRFLAFHTHKQRDLFLKENEDLIRQYFMLD